MVLSITYLILHAGATDIYEGNLRLILGLVWTLIRHYQIAGHGSSDADDSPESREVKKKRLNAKKLLLNWIRAALHSEDVGNFTTNWNDGLRLSALVDFCKPGLIPDHASLDPGNRLANVTHAMDLAESELGVPKVMHPEDLAVDKPDELSVMTYVSGFCKPNSAGLNSLLEWVNSKIPNRPVSNFTTDWSDGKALAALVDALTQGQFPECDQMTDVDNYKNCQEAMDAADRLLGVNKTVPPEEFSENDLDQLTRSTYIAQFKHATLKPEVSIVSTLKAVGPGITGASATKETNFVVRGPRIPSWAKLSATVKSSDGTELPVKMQSTSLKATQFQYTPETPGEYVIEITLNDDFIPGAPFNVTHVPPTNVDGCVATGSGLSKARVGETTGFSVNCEEGGPGELQVDIEGPTGNSEAEIEEATAKNYNVNFTPSEAGDHSISVLWDNKNIPSSPFTCTVTDPKKCSISGSGLNRALIGEPQVFTVRADKAGPGEVSVKVEGPNGSVPADVKENGQNVFDITYIPKDTGKHMITVLWRDDPIPGSPFTVNAVAPADASKCSVSNLPEGRLQSNNDYSFNVDTSEAGFGELKASAHGPTVPETCTVKDSGNGVFSVNFTPAEVGPLKVETSYDENAIPQSPFEYTVNDPTKVKVNRAAIENGTYQIKQPIQFVVSANHAGEGEITATIRNQSGEEEVGVKDQGNKSYLLNYSPSEGGSHAINIKFDGYEIPDIPIRIFVDDSSHADKVVVTEPLVSKIGSYLVESPYDFKVIAANAGQDELTVTCSGVHTGLKPSINVVDDGNDRYTVTLTAAKPDDYIVNIQWGEEHVPGSPFKLCIEDKPQADKVVCTGPYYKVGSSESVTLDVNAENAGAGKLSASCSGSKGNSPSVDITEKEKEPKKYVLAFTPPEDDIYVLNVLWLSEKVKDSPFEINLIPPDASKCIVNGPEVPIDPTEPIVLYVDASNAGNGAIAVSAVGDKTGEKDVLMKETEPHKYVLSFIPNITDFYTMNVTWGGENVPGAPFRVNSSAANADKVMICEPPTPMLEAGQAIGICFDTSKGGKGTLTAICKGNTIGEIPITVRQRSMAKEKYDVRFLPPEPDVFLVSVLWSGVDVKGSPFTINLMPVDVNKIRVIGPNMPHGPEGPVELMLQAAGAGKGKVTGVCTRNSNGEQVEVAIKETSADIYQLVFIPPEPDIYNFDVQYGSQKLNGSPFLINTLPPKPNLVKVKEPDSIDLSQALVYNVDATEAGSGKLNTFVRGDKCGQIRVDTVSEMVGMFDVSFTPRQADLYSITMEWDGKDVPNSPFRVDLRPPMADKVIVGELHVPDEAGMGNYVWLDLDCSDAGHGPLKGEAKGNQAGKMPIEANRLSRAKYQMKFLPHQPDIYNFAVAYGDHQVVGSPFKINLLPPQADKVKHTRTTLPELEGGPVSMHFDTAEAGKGEMTVSITNDSNDSVTKKVEKMSFTEHKITFIPSVPDIYNVDVKWSGKPVHQSPFKVDTRPPLYPELIECGQPIYSDINLPVHLSLDTRKAGPGKIAAKCKIVDGEEVPVEIKRPSSPDEKYDISFTPEVHGLYDLSVYFEGEEISNSPFPVNLKPVSEVADMVELQDVVESIFIPDDMVSPETTEEKPAESNELVAFIGDPLTLAISAEDEEERRGTLKATVSGDKTGRQDVNVKKNADDTFDVYFNPSVPDRYTMDVLLNDKHVPNSPFIVTYLYPVDSSKCRIFDLQNIPSVPQVGEPICFGIDAKQAGDGKLSVTSDGPSLDDKPSTLEMKESDKEEPGVYYITYIPTSVGEHRVHPLWSGDKIPGTPLVFQVGDMRQIQRFPYGKPVNININSESSKTGDLHAFAIHEDSENKSKVKISKEKKDNFKLSFQPKEPGIYAIHVQLKKREIPGSPFRIRYLGPPDPKGVVVSKFTEKGIVDYPVAFTLNAEQAGTGELAVRVEGPKTIKDSDLTYAPCPESKELCYNVSYVPRNPGDHQFHVTWAGKPIPSSPLNTIVSEIKPEYKTALQGKGINIVEVGQPANAWVVNAGPGLNQESITANCEGEKSGDVDVSIQKEEEEGDGKVKYLIQFVPKAVDDYTLSVKLNNNNIDGSPFKIKAVDKEVLALDYIHPAEPQPSDVTAAEPVNILRNAAGITSPEDLNVSVEGPYGSCPPMVTTDSNEVFGIGFLPPFSGEYKIKAEKDGTDIPGCPCKVIATGKDPDPSKVSILDEDKAIFETPLPLGKPARFRIATTDAGPGTLSITSRGPGKAVVKVFDNKDGSYTCDFSPKIAGKYHIDILWNEKHINGSPFLLEFKSKKSRVIAGLNLENENFRIDVPHRFKLHCGEVGDGILEIICKPASAADIRLSPLETGKNSYQCTIIPKEVGNREIFVQYNGKHIFGSPFNVQFEQRGDASKCRMVESSVAGQEVIHEDVSFLISTEGAGKGKLTSFTEMTSSKTKLPVTITPLPDHMYKIEFNPEEEEEYLLTVKYDNEHILGSPFKLMFGGNAADASQCTAVGDGIEACVVDQEAKFVVNSIRANNGELSVTIAGEEQDIVPKLTPRGNTETEVEYLIDKPGKYVISVKWTNEEIANSPFNVECYNPSDPGLLTLENIPSEVFLGSPVNFTVRTTVGPVNDGTLTVTSQSPQNRTIQGKVEKSEDGLSYNCLIDDISDPGRHSIHARWNGSHIKNSPFNLKVVTPPKPQNVKAYGPGLENSLIGQEGNFTIETQDGGVGTLTVRVFGPKGAFKINMRRHPDNDRIILARYDPTHIGKYTVEITWSDEHIPGSPFNVIFSKQ